MLRYREILAAESLQVRTRVRKSWKHETLNAHCAVFEFLVMSNPSESGACCDILAHIVYFQTLELFGEGAFGAKSKL
jgi:hypothetical protein